MDTPQRRPNPQDAREREKDPLDEISLPDDVEEDVEGIDDAAILNELLRDLSPELLEEEKKPDEPEESAVETERGELTAAESKREEEPLLDLISREEPAADERPSPVALGQERVIEETEPAEAEGLQAEQAEGEEGIFDRGSLDEALSVLTGDETPEEPEAEEAEAEAVESVASPRAPMDDSKAFDEAFDALLGSEEAAEQPEEEAEGVAVPPVAEAVTAATAAAAATTGGVEEAAADTDDIVRRIAVLIAQRYIRMARVPGAAPVQPAEREARAGFLEAEIEEEFVIAEEAVPAGEAAPPEIPAEERPEKAVEELDVELLGAAGLLSPEERERAESAPSAPSEPEPELSLDDLITSAVLTPTEEKKPKEPAPEEAERPEEGAQVVGGAPTAPGEEAEEREPVPARAPEPIIAQEFADDEVLRQIRAAARRKKIIRAGVLVVVAAAVAVFIIRSPKTADEEAVVQPQQELAQQAAEGPTQPAEEERQTEGPSQPRTEPSTRPPSAEQPIARAETRQPPALPTSAQETAIQPPKLPTSPGGGWTVHVESVAFRTGRHGADASRRKWEDRGYEVLVWPFDNPNDGHTWYRIGIGRYASRTDGEQGKQLLKQAYPTEIDWSPVTRIPQGAE